MPSVEKVYGKTTVYEESKERIRYIFDTHDDVVVAFSGGKDSLVAMHLVREVAAEYGIDKVNVEYRDEEMVPKPVLDIVEYYRNQPWCDLKYFACQWQATSFILGRVRSYLQWDETREPFVRPKPSHAITLPGDYDELFGFDEITSNVFSKGKVALILGVRAEESMNRWRSVVNKKTDNYINPSGYSNRLNICKPIFDWRMNDVLKYIYDNEVEYCKLYNMQMWAGDRLRVCSPLHATPAKQLHKLREVDPTCYEQIVTIFPEVTVQEKYWLEVSFDKIIDQYGGSFGSMREWLMNNLDVDQLRTALHELDSVFARWQNTPMSYPKKWIFHHFVTGKYLHPIQPLDEKQRKAWLSDFDNN